MSGQGRLQVLGGPRQKRDVGPFSSLHSIGGRAPPQQRFWLQYPCTFQPLNLRRSLSLLFEYKYQLLPGALFQLGAQSNCLVCVPDCDRPVSGVVCWQWQEETPAIICQYPAGLQSHAKSNWSLCKMELSTLSSCNPSRGKTDCPWRVSGGREGMCLYWIMFFPAWTQGSL